MDKKDFRKNNRKFNADKYEENMEHLDDITQKTWKIISNFSYIGIITLQMIFCMLLIIPSFIMPIYQANAFGGLLYIAIGILIVFAFIKPIVMRYTPLVSFLIVIFICQNVGSFSFIWAFIGAVISAIYLYQGIKTIISLKE